MGWTEAAALKPSAQMDVKSNSQATYNDDVLSLGETNSVSSNDFPVEDLLNLDFPQYDTLDTDFDFFFPNPDEFDAGQLPLQIDDDSENLEWVSHFVNDEVSLICPVDNITKTGEVHRDIRSESVNIPVPRKARSKRSRRHGRAWYMVLPAAQDQRRKPDNNGGPVSGRKCSHCHVQKTPQWRTGPLGPKTLCNACGVRFNSGRLFPEYRPACSPTFSREKHSNSHKKVMEMRRRKMPRGRQFSWVV